MDRFDIVSGHYAFYCDHYESQYSRKYERLCKIMTYYNPGVMFSGYRSLNDCAKEVYLNLAFKDSEKRLKDYPNYTDCGISIKDVFNDLQRLLDTIDGLTDEDSTLDVRLRVYTHNVTSEICYEVLFGDSQYDQDHSGFWGHSSISKSNDSSDLVSIAHNLMLEVFDSLI